MFEVSIVAVETHSLMIRTSHSCSTMQSFSVSETPGAKAGLRKFFTKSFPPAGGLLRNSVSRFCSQSSTPLWFHVLRLQTVRLHISRVGTLDSVVLTDVFFQFV